MKTSLIFRRPLVAGLAMIFLPPAGAQQFKRAYDLAPALGSTACTVDAQILGRTVQLPGEPPTAGLGNKSCIADLNGDGVDDLVLANYRNGDSGYAAGRVHVWFGGAGFGGLMDLETSPADLTILAASPEDKLGADYNVGQDTLATGDVNGDGITDLILGAFQADGPADSRSNCGEAYVIFGRAVFPAMLDLAVQGPGGADVTIQGALPGDSLTRGTIETADLNDDGIDDLILPAMRLTLDRRVHVLFGRPVFPAVMDLAVPANTSVTIGGGSVSGAFNGLVGQNGAIATADVNGDGTEDLILGDARAGGPAESRPESGEAYIVFGRKAPAMFPATLDVQVQGSAGADVTIHGGYADRLGEWGTLQVGDLNDDGLGDLLITNSGAGGPLDARPSAGEAYILFGRTGVSGDDQEIVVEQAPGNGLADGSATVDFGVVNPGFSGTPVTIKIKNTGALLLNVTGISTSGGESGEFAVTSPTLPDVIWPGQEITFDVTFTPGAEGPRGTMLQIASDDADEATFDIVLAGTGNSPPVLQLPASPVVVTATSPAGAIVNFSVTATDAEDTPDPTPVATPPGGSLFPEGETLVSVEVTDSGGLVTTGSFTVRVDPAGTYAAAWRQLKKMPGTL
jgi:hypothetical protein